VETDRESELDTREKDRVGVVKHGRIVRRMTGFDACATASRPTYRAACLPLPRFGFLFRVAVSPRYMRAYSRGKQHTTFSRTHEKHHRRQPARPGNFHILLSAFKAAALIDTLRSPASTPYLRPPMPRSSACRPARSMHCSRTRAPSNLSCSIT
jgi:hypothetical protein